MDGSSNLCGERDGNGTRYRLDMARNAKADNGHAISRLADSGEETIRHLVALPLRMLAGTLGIFEAVLRTAADTLREMDPLDERIVGLGEARGLAGGADDWSPRERTVDECSKKEDADSRGGGRT